MFRVERVDYGNSARHSTDEHPSRKRFDRIYSATSKPRKDVVSLSTEGKKFAELIREKCNL